MHRSPVMAGGVGRHHAGSTGDGKLMILYILTVIASGFIGYFLIHRHSVLMRTGGEGEHTHVHRDIHERHPERHRITRIQRPVILILVPGRRPSSRLLEQGLIMIDPYPAHAKKIRRYPGQTPGYHKWL